MNLSEAYAMTKKLRPTWQETAAGYQTVQINSNHVQRIWTPERDLLSITALDAINLIEQLQDEGKAPGTVNRITSTFRTVNRMMIRMKVMTESIYIPILEEPIGRTEVYTPEEIEQMVEACQHLENDRLETKELIVCAANLGVRQGELLKLKWPKVLFDENSIWFWNAKHRSDRTLPMPPAVREVMDRRYRDRIDDDKVFSLDKDSLLRRLRQVQKMCGISEDKCFHTLRHTACTRLWEANNDLITVMAIMGHRRAETTLRYSHANKEKIREALNNL